MKLPARGAAVLVVPLLALSIAVPSALGTRDRPAHTAANLPHYPCASLPNTAAMLMCLDGQLRALNRQTGTIAAQIRRLYHRVRGGVADFNAAQSAWRAFAKADCTSQSVMYSGGTLQPVAAEQCLVLDTRARLAQLKTQRYGLRNG